eukprot:9678942-Lingulodinium_polyedra.AAC.1
MASRASLNRPKASGPAQARRQSARGPHALGACSTGPANRQANRRPATRQVRAPQTPGARCKGPANRQTNRGPANRQVRARPVRPVDTWPDDLPSLAQPPEGERAGPSKAAEAETK